MNIISELKSQVYTFPSSFSPGRLQEKQNGCWCNWRRIRLVKCLFTCSTSPMTVTYWWVWNGNFLFISRNDIPLVISGKCQEAFSNDNSCTCVEWMNCRNICLQVFNEKKFVQVDTVLFENLFPLEYITGNSTQNSIWRKASLESSQLFDMERSRMY